MSQPLIAITMGDPAGVGPETIAGAWSNPALHELCRAVVIGHPAVMRRAVALFAHKPELSQRGNIAPEVVEVSSLSEVASSPSVLPCLKACRDDAADVPPCQIDPRGGQAAYDALLKAAELARSGQVQAITTAPLHKAALWQAGHHYPGHTELLAELCGVQDFAMMLYLGHDETIRSPHGLAVVHVTLHMALRQVFEHLSPQAILAKAQLADNIMRRLMHADGISTASAQPRIGISALNPHAGEEGLFGDEEERIIRPAVAQARASGLQVEGPLPADTLLVRARDGQFDAVVAMYHDQGHIALKLLGMHRAVNVTLGLPIIRTSVAHGTAFDLAWQGRAETSSLIEALRVAAKLSTT